MFGENNNICNNITRIENMLENIFNQFSNFDFENISCTAYIYKNKIYFVPLIMKEKVDNLFVVYNKLIESRGKNLIRKR